MTEHKLQTGVNAYLCLALPPDAFMTGIDHARKQSVESGMLQKQRGIRAGIPDIIIVYKGIAHWIELKVPTNAHGLSDVQKAVHKEIIAAGGLVAVGNSVGDVEMLCRKWGIPLRATMLSVPERDARLAKGGKSSHGARPRQAKPTASQIRRAEAVRSKVLF